MKRLLLAALLSLAPVTASAKPRAISLDYCADQYLLKLADAAQITALSRGADRDYSHLRNDAGPYRKIRPTLEEVAPLKADIVLRQWGGGANATQNFSRFGAKVVSLGFPEDFSGVKDNIRIAAQALNQQGAGEALINDINQRLKILEDTSHNRPVKALYVTPGGVTAGAHTMINAIMHVAGVTNIAAEAGQSYWPQLPAEALLLDPPDLIIAGFFDSHDERINHWSAARHPALRKLLEETPTVRLPPDLLSCAAWFSLDAAEAIARELRQQ